MLFSALAAAVGSYYANNPWVGLACGAVCGILISLLHAFLCISVRVDQIVIGLVINIFAANTSVYLLSVLFKNKGTSPAITKLPYVSIPFLRDIPGMSELFANISVLTVAANHHHACRAIFTLQGRDSVCMSWRRDKTKKPRLSWASGSSARNIWR